MTSLSDVYEGNVGSVVDRRQRILGAGLFVTGVVAVAVAIVVGTTGIGATLGLDFVAAREVAGILAGLGLPAVFVGIVAVLPASPAVRAAAAVGAGLAVLGTALFGHAYPEQWISADPVLTALTILVYSVGTLVIFWCLFAGLATFETRDDPGGTARLNVTEAGTVRIVSDTTDRTRSGVGLTSTPDGGVATQTNREPVHDVTDRAEQDDAEEQAPTATRRARPDTYCGNCAHFEYVRADGEIAPYCGLRHDLMADMDACEEWESNS
jgi:cytochrome c biogenesis protein CcdA